MKIVNTGKQYRIYEDNLSILDNLLPATYIVRFSERQGFFLEKYPSFEIKEEKVYGVHTSKIDKVMNSFGQFDRNLGVILSGDKGIGKSLFAKMLCNTSIEAGIPVIVVDMFVPGIHSFIEEIEQEVVVLFDEFDKTFGNASRDRGGEAQVSMLSLFDGISAGKKMYVITCNELRALSEYLVNRPGRFHYHIRFGYPNSQEVETYLKDKIDNKYWGEIPKVMSFATKINLNYDCLRAIAFELQNGETFESAVLDLNILNIVRNQYDISVYFESGEMTKNTCGLDMFDNSVTSVEIGSVKDIYLVAEFNPSVAKYDVERGCSILLPTQFKVKNEYNDKKDLEVMKTLTATHIELRRKPEHSYHYAV